MWFAVVRAVPLCTSPARGPQSGRLRRMHLVGDGRRYCHERAKSRSISSTGSRAARSSSVSRLGPGLMWSALATLSLTSFTVLLGRRSSRRRLIRPRAVLPLSMIVIIVGLVTHAPCLPLTSDAAQDRLVLDPWNVGLGCLRAFADHRSPFAVPHAEPLDGFRVDRSRVGVDTHDQPGFSSFDSQQVSRSRPRASAAYGAWFYASDDRRSCVRPPGGSPPRPRLQLPWCRNPRRPQRVSSTWRICRSPVKSPLLAMVPLGLERLDGSQVRLATALVFAQHKQIVSVLATKLFEVHGGIAVPVESRPPKSCSNSIHDSLREAFSVSPAETLRRAASRRSEGS